jgi:hypothetical protein
VHRLQHLVLKALRGFVDDQQGLMSTVILAVFDSH